MRVLTSLAFALGKGVSRQSQTGQPCGVASVSVWGCFAERRPGLSFLRVAPVWGVFMKLVLTVEMTSALFTGHVSLWGYP